jgi:TRAP-type uncharacterized transport system substrate-binding protein
LLVALTGSVVATIALARSSRPRTHRVHMLTDLVPLRKAMAEQIRAEASRRGLDLVLSSKQYGALEALKEVDAPNDIKLALIPGGITAGQYPNLRTVTTLTSEPLHVLVRPGLTEKGYAALRGKRINIGPVTTCSHHLAREVLEFAGLTPSAKSGSTGYILETTSPEDLDRELQRIESLGDAERAQAIGKLPDAVVFLAPMPSQLAKHLVRGVGYQFLPMPFGEAFCLDRLNPPNPHGVLVDRSALTPSVIPPYTYGADPPVPAKACPTISVPLLLVAQDDTDPEAVYRLLEIVHDSPLTSALHPPSLRQQSYPSPPHAGTERFLRRHDPLITPETMSMLGRVLGGIGAFASGAIAVYTWLRLRKLNRFEAYYREIGQIERVARGLEQDREAPTTPNALRTHLEKRLSALECRVLEDFAEGGLKGEASVTAVIATIKETRSTLPLALASRREQQSSSVPSSQAQKI